MNLRALLTILFAAIPLIVIALFLVSREEVTPNELAAKSAPSVNWKLPSSTLSAKKIYSDATAEFAAGYSHDSLTEARYEAARKAAKIDPDAYQFDEKFLLDKYRAEFDEWDFSQETRRAIVAAIGNHSKESARAFRDANLSWPLTVGDMSNTDGHLAHQRDLLRQLGQLRQRLQTELEATGGESFGKQFTDRYFPQISTKAAGGR